MGTLEGAVKSDKVAFDTAWAYLADRDGGNEGKYVNQGLLKTKDNKRKNKILKFGLFLTKRLVKWRVFWNLKLTP